MDSCLLMGSQKGYEGLRRAAGTMVGSGGPWAISGTLGANWGLAARKALCQGTGQSLKLSYLGGYNLYIISLS
jgi:hypothetical protein